jgi:hypothetical protein
MTASRPNESESAVAALIETYRQGFLIDSKWVLRRSGPPTRTPDISLGEGDKAGKRARQSSKGDWTFLKMVNLWRREPSLGWSSRAEEAARLSKRLSRLD